MTDNAVAEELSPPSLEQEFIQVIRKTILRHPVPVLTGHTVMAAACYSTLPTEIVVGWWLIAFTALFGRAAYLRRIISSPVFSDERRLRHIYVSIAIVGAVQALPIIAIPMLALPQAVLITLVIAVLCMGVTATNAGFPQATMPYVSLQLGALSIAWLASPPNSGISWMPYLIGVFVVLMFMALAGIRRDIYHLFKNSVELRQKYASAAQALSQALHESQSANAAKTRFLAAASHDLRQPVHTLSLLTAAMIARNNNSRTVDARTAEIATTMEQSVQSLARQLDTLLDISKLDAGIITPEIGPVDIAAIIELLRREYLPLAKAKGLFFSVTAPAEAYVLTDPTLIERVLRNLMSNAVKYTQRGGIEVRIDVAGDFTSIAAKDTGIGIAPDQHELVFEEFYQIDNPHRDRAKGLGLGLSIVRRMCRLMNIPLSMDSTPGKGTEFVMRIESCANPNQFAHNTPLRASFANLKVLVVDDEGAIRIATKAYLEELQCEVLVAEDGAQALELVRAHSIQLLIVDFRLRNHESGLQTLLAIRALHPTLPAIMITGDTAPDRLKEAVSVQAKLLHKPILPNQLQLAIQEVLFKKVA